MQLTVWHNITHTKVPQKNIQILKTTFSHF